jgi:hypothetical protein
VLGRAAAEQHQQSDGIGARAHEQRQSGPTTQQSKVRFEKPMPWEAVVPERL